MMGYLRPQYNYHLVKVILRGVCDTTVDLDTVGKFSIHASVLIAYKVCEIIELYFTIL